MRENSIEKNQDNSSDVIKKIGKSIEQTRIILRKISDLEKISAPWGVFSSEEANLFLKNLNECDIKQKIDLLIWKYYSQTGGIHDVLHNFEIAVKKPSANAFDFDEDENCYYIFITLNNSLLNRLSDLVGLMKEQCGEIQDESEVTNEANDLFSLFNRLKQSHERIRNQDKRKKMLDEYEKEYIKLSKMPSRKRKTKGYLPNDISSPLNSLLTKLTSALDCPDDAELLRVNSQTSAEVLLKNVSLLLKTIQQELNQYTRTVETYNYQRDLFTRKYESLRLYDAKYSSLFESICTLCSMTEEGGELYGLTLSPSTKAEIDMYMQLAEVFCEKAIEITKEYPI